MDAERFDTLARSLTGGGSRRHALTGLLAGALGLLSWPDQEDIVAHDLKDKCKKKSGDAKKTCFKKAKKHKAQHAEESQPVACPSSCRVCQTCSNGACVPNRAVDDASCNGTGKCFNGVCNPQPTCGGALTDGACLTPAQCCSQTCASGYGCNFVQKGGPCVDHGDCASQTCVGYRCVQGTLAVGATCHPIVPDECASGQCGCSGPVTCTCRKATCGGAGARCNPGNATDPAVRDRDCCDGTCEDVIAGSDGFACRAR